MRFVFFLAAMLASSSAAAYMGPGAGLGMLGSLLAVGGALLLAITGIIVLPVRMVLKRRRKAEA
jgi:uncharacterized membrane protein YphA (DoxX/SURF4 family)